MRRKYPIFIILLGLILVLAFAGFAIWQSVDATPAFDSGGYILQSKDGQAQTLTFHQGSKYNATISGEISFESVEEGKVSVPRERFAHLDDGGTMAFSDGVLLDLNDLSENFINNYFIPEGLVISGADQGFSAQTTAGDIQFGEHIWKLTDSMYIIRSAGLTVHFSSSESYSAGQYAQIYVTADKVVHIQCAEDHWMTISPDCYIRTAKGVKIYPTSLLVDNGVYKLSLAKLSVNSDDTIVLTELETRRQIVPELKIEAIDGEDGTDGKSGSEGGTGQNGVGGEGGKNGGWGSDGLNAISDSTINSALPTMAISDWRLSGEQLQGTILVQDTAGFLEALGDEKSKYPGKVTITNISTGEKIECYQTFSTSHDLTATDTEFSFADGSEEIFFSTKPKALKPDTEYNLSVTAYYRTDKPDMIYSREFINRNFTTTSTGAGLSYVSSTQNSLTISASVLSDMKSATVYLMTPEQNKTFTNASIGEDTNYLASWKVGTDENGTVPGALKPGTYTWNFPNLTPDTEYVLRIYTVSGSLSALSKQELTAKTLKQMPKWTGKPTATYYRVNGAFAGTRPTTMDPDNGAVRYIYTAYTYDTDPDTGVDIEVVAGSRTITPSEAEPVEFILNTGKSYTIGVTMEFNDNYTTTYFDMGRSDPIAATGQTIPSLTLTGEPEYDGYKGVLRISLHENSKLTIDGNNKLYLDIYADQVLQETVDLYDSTPGEVVDGHLGNFTLHDRTNVSEQLVGVKLTNLFGSQDMSQVYTITVRGTVDLGDGFGDTQMSLGTVSFQTRKAPKLSASWSKGPSKSSISVLASIAVTEEGGDTVGGSTATSTVSQVDHTVEQLKQGKVKATLYSGSGTQKKWLGEATIADREKLELLYGTGLELTENDFANAGIASNANYTIEITYVSDKTGILKEQKHISYENDFTPVDGGIIPVTSEATPPNLLRNPSDGITAIPIRLSDAYKYGVRDHYLAENENLPEDTIIGYSLTANYDHGDRITNSITYYAFEYKTYATLLADGKDPIRESNDKDILMSETLDMSTTKTVPKLAVFFGTAPAGKEDTLENGHYLHWPTKDPITGEEGSLSRGFRYVFAYTTQYSKQSVYPYEHSTYPDFMKLYGGLTVNGKTLGTDAAYVLNSGVVEAPWVEPSFYSYVQTSSTDNLTLYYTWVDPEGMIVTEEDAELSGEETTKVYLSKDSSEGQYIGEFPVNVQSDDSDDSDDSDAPKPLQWYSLNLPMGSAIKQLTPYVGISEYHLQKEYNVPIVIEDTDEEVNLAPNDSDRVMLTRVPVEPVYKRQSFDGDFGFRLTAYDADYGDLRLELTKGPSVSSDVAKRAVAMRFCITPVDADGNDAGEGKEFLIPLDYSSTELYGRVTKSILSEFRKTRVRIDSVALLYDTGRQGWEFAQEVNYQDENGELEDSYYAIQYYSSDNAGLGSYEDGRYSSQDTFVIKANGGAWGKPAKYHSDELLKLLTGENGDGEPQGRQFEYDVYSPVRRPDEDVRSHFRRWLFPTQMGIGVSANSGMGLVSNTTAVPKKLEFMKLNNQGGSLYYEVPESPPSVTYPNFGDAVTSISVSGFRVYGATNVKVACYTNENAAKALGEEGRVGDPVAVQLDAQGNSQGTIRFTGLAKDTTYHFVIYYEPEGGTKPIILTRHNAKDVDAVYPSKTISDAGIKVSSINMSTDYVNTDYFNKSLTMRFTMANTESLYMEYDLYKGTYDPKGDTAVEPLIKYKDMVRVDPNDPDYNPNQPVAKEGGILDVPRSLTNSSSTPNILKLDLTPSLTSDSTPNPNRKLLKPGQTYTMVFTAYEKETQPRQTAGVAHVTFTIPSIGNYGAFITVPGVGTYTENGLTSPEIRYEVTVYDDAHSFMGASNTYARDFGGLYAVRFVDKDGNLIKTNYDDKVYSSLKLDKQYKSFVLNEGVMSVKEQGAQKLNFNETYTILVFAAPDNDHDGQLIAGKLNEDGTKGPGYAVKGYHDFFSVPANQQETEDSRHTWGAEFNKVIDSFWEPTKVGEGENAVTIYTPKEDAATVEMRKALLVGSHEQETGSEGGYLLKLGGIIAKKVSGKFRIEFRQSYNLVDDNGCVFSKILIQFDGQTSDGRVLAEVVELDNSSGTMIQMDSATKTYYLTVPESMLECPQYKITLHLYERGESGGFLQHTFEA